MNRRAFLNGLAIAPALAASDSSAQAAPTAPRAARGGLKLGTVTYNIAKDWDVPTLIKNLSDTGFEAVELRTTHKHGVELTLSPEARAEVRKRFADSPVKIGGLGTTCEFHAADPAVVRKNVDETKQWVKLAQDIGSPGVKVRPNGLPKDVPEEKTREQIGKALAECGAAARDAGVFIQLEVHGEGTSRLPRVRKMLDYGGNQPGVRVCWNSNQTDFLDGGFAANFKLVRDQIGQVHMRDLFLIAPAGRCYSNSTNVTKLTVWSGTRHEERSSCACHNLARPPVWDDDGGADVSDAMYSIRGLWPEFGWGGIDEPGPQTESSIERGFRVRGPVDDQWGRSESFDPDRVGDIADEGTGHRG